MSIAGINFQHINMASMVQSREKIDSVMKSVVSEANGDNGNPLGVSFEFSQPAELFSKLSQLQSSDPETFKSLMNDIAEKLQEAADETEDDDFNGKMLADLASKFKNAAETGDLTQLKPPPPPPPTNTDSDSSKISQYLQNSSDDDQMSLIDLLSQLEESDSDSSSTGTSLDDTINSIRSLLLKAFQQMEQKATEKSS
ncbi:MAG TPA: hypothetical protein PLQ76_08815 [bacterium]|nr:hypothetical protein [bacterium]